MPFGTNPFLGGVPSGTATTETLSLSITQAFARALEHNLGALTAEAAISHSAGTRWITLSQLLPNVGGRVSETRQKVNLAAFGFPLPPGIPPVVGPFNVFDARVYASQSVVDLRALNELREDTHKAAASQFTYKSARDLVVLVTANAYLQSLAAAARVESVKAQLDTAQAIYNQASDMKANGLVPGIDVLRAQVQLSTQQQRSTAAANDFDKAKLQLARIIGLPVGQPFTLSEQLPAVPAPDITLEQALERAYATRPDYQAALERVRAAEAARNAASAEFLPSVHVNADYGEIGLTIPSSVATYAVTGAVNVPIFQGGRSRGRVIEADSDLRDRRAEAEDLRSGIYYDVRSAFLDLRASGEQLEVATRARDLANQAMTQARDRFAAGVANNIEVVQAQEDVALASEQYIGALYNFDVAKALLARGIGIAEQATSQFLGGTP
jgi:outer membrane protein TolC